ncbi:MAG: phosphoenolpyruvate synthase [Nanoarchaeota archaeon]|nr:phosphoenolpyruvate synthase [Nanoarchaeota archaeon]
MGGKYILWHNSIYKKDTPIVGGKTSSLGEMINRVEVPIPEFFAITASAYQHFVKNAGLDDDIERIIKELDVHNLKSLQSVGRRIRSLLLKAKFSKELDESILSAYKRFEKETKQKNVRVAVRSSATAEDLPTASFAGQQETFLNVRGGNDLLQKVKECFASLFTDRAISYREDMNFDHLKVYLSVTIQRMVNSKSSGVAFTIDPDSGFRNVVFINGSWGLGELVVQGKVTPDEFVYFKPTKVMISKKVGAKRLQMLRALKGNKIVKTPENLRKKFVISDEQVLQLGNYCVMIEEHYGMPMDIEWALSDNNKLYILQARPETVHASNVNIIEKFSLTGRGKTLVSGKAVGRKIGCGNVRIIKDAKGIHSFKKGETLVTTMTDPDWEPIMKIASAIVTDLGGSTSHAAIVSREIGVPALVGCSDATKKLRTGQLVTVDCTNDPGKVLQGKVSFNVKKIKVDSVPKTRTKIMVNIGVPEQAFDLGQLPIDGVGLAREEFIIANYIGEHPLKMIKEKREQEYIDKLAEGVAKIAAGFYPRDVIVRLSDFKSNEYKTLKGGEEFEPDESNPMIGWRGASRYISPLFEPAFRLECKAIKKVRDDLGLVNLIPMIPFCRTLNEARKVLKIMRSEGLKRGLNKLQIYVMAEVPSNIILVEEFAELFDGFSIGTNDLTQLTLGMDRDSSRLSDEFDERDPAVLSMVEKLIKGAHKKNRKVGICGQAPSDHPGYAKFLVDNGIDSISLNPDVVLETKLKVGRIEKGLKK